MQTGLLIVVSSPSGGGKTTLVRELRKKVPEVHYSVSLTTRAPRHNEQQGVDYFFVTEQEFEARKKAGELVEFALVHGAWYGTPKNSIEQHLLSGRCVILDIDVQGGKSIHNIFPEAVLVCIAPPSLLVLEKRLRDRKQDSEATIQTRLQAAAHELDEARRFYDYLIINDQLELALDRFCSVIAAEQLRIRRNAG